MLDPVPWFVGGGAEHSPEVARLLSYAATGGAEGIAGVNDLKVLSLATPGSSVRVSPGAGVMVNKAASGGQQSYIGRCVSDEVVNIAATGSAGGRSDLIVLRVEDPHMPGEPWQLPTDVKVGPYVFVRVISGVSSTATTMPEGQTGIVLARVDIPASTATITQSMIRDLRTMARPRSSRLFIPAYPNANNDLTVTDMANPQTWPAAGSHNVEVPSWATHAHLRADISGALALAAIDGGHGIRLGSLAVQNSGYNVGSGGRHALISGGTVNVSGLRGTVQTVRTTGYRNGTAGALRADTGTAVFVTIDFVEAPV